MKSKLLTRIFGLCALLTVTAVVPIRAVATEDLTGTLEVLRSAYGTDRQAFLAEKMQLTPTEASAFWPLYRQYRAAQESLGDDLVKLVLEYADAYPGISEDRAQDLLKRYSAVEKKYASHRTSYFKKFAKILPASKALRFAQLENRMDVVLRLQLASAIPLAPRPETH